MLCLYCKSETDNPKFCSSSCAAKLNNHGVRRHGNKTKVCLVCSKKTNYSKSKFCSHKCQWKHNLDSIIMPAFYAGSMTKQETAKKCFIIAYGNTCQLCKNNGSWLKQPLVLHLDHIDGNKKNYHPSNLRLLCPNCHQQTETWGRKRYANARTRT